MLLTNFDEASPAAVAEAELDAYMAAERDGDSPDWYAENHYQIELYRVITSEQRRNWQTREGTGQNLAFVLWCFRGTEMFYAGRMPIAVSGPEFYDGLRATRARFFSKEEIQTAKYAAPVRDDLILFRRGEELSAGIVIDADGSGLLTYICFSDATHRIERVTKHVLALDDGTFLVRWKGAWDYLLPLAKDIASGLQLPNAAAVGVLANIWAESKCNTFTLGDDGTSYGLCQWHCGRLDRLYEYCSIRDLDWASYAGQIAYLCYEMESDYPDTLAWLRGVDDDPKGAAEAAEYFCRWYERPEDIDGQCDVRRSMAESLFVQMFPPTVDELADIAAEQVATERSEADG